MTLRLLAVFLAACAASQTEAPEPATTTHTYRTHESRPPAQTAASTTACDGGDFVACHAAALDAYYAPSTPDSDTRARVLFERGCDGGYAPSCNGLGTLHDQGRGVPQDHVTAVALFRKACAADSSTACQHLAQALRIGRGVAKDEAAAARADARHSCLFEASLATNPTPCAPLDNP
jgi:TPR repeat protein